MDELNRWLELSTQQGLLTWSDQLKIAHRFDVSVACVENTALRKGILPARYQRNRPLLTCQDQLRLFSSHVVVVGCGGLGGHIIESLARVGVGCMTVVDPDVFEEHNLNRQSLATFETLGRRKVDVATERVAKINPAVTVIPCFDSFTLTSGPKILAGSQVVVDALDDIARRMELSAQCRGLAVPLVHAAIDGWYGHVLTQYPGENSLETVYAGKCQAQRSGCSLGAPACTPALIAAIEVAETLKILIARGVPLRQRLLMVDLLDMEFIEVVI